MEQKNRAVQERGVRVRRDGPDIVAETGNENLKFRNSVVPDPLDEAACRCVGDAAGDPGFMFGDIEGESRSGAAACGVDPRLVNLRQTLERIVEGVAGVDQAAVRLFERLCRCEDLMTGRMVRQAAVQRVDDYDISGARVGRMLSPVSLWTLRRPFPFLLSGRLGERRLRSVRGNYRHTLNRSISEGD